MGWGGRLGPLRATCPVKRPQRCVGDVIIQGTRVCGDGQSSSAAALRWKWGPLGRCQGVGGRERGRTGASGRRSVPLEEGSLDPSTRSFLRLSAASADEKLLGFGDNQEILTETAGSGVRFSVHPAEFSLWLRKYTC